MNTKVSASHRSEAKEAGARVWEGMVGRCKAKKSLFSQCADPERFSAPPPSSLVLVYLLSTWATQWVCNRTMTGQESPALQSLSFRNDRDQTEAVKHLSK